MCRKRGIQGVTERTTRDNLVNALKRDDREKQFVVILKGFAEDLGVPIGEANSWLELATLLEPAMVKKLKADGYIADDGLGQTFQVGFREWALTGRIVNLAGRTEVEAQDVTQDTYYRKKKMSRVLYLYHHLYARGTVPRDDRITKWLGLG